MNCEEAIRLMDGYLDAELDPITSQAIEQHLQGCPSCNRAYKAHLSLIGVIGNVAPYYKAPAELRKRIQSALRQESGEHLTRDLAPDADSLFRQRPPAQPAIFSGTSWNWLALAAAIVLAAIIAFTFLPRLRGPRSDQFLATQLIASHVRSLLANHLTDVASSDQHTVKPWLDTKLDFAPAVVDLSSDGFPLIGGRLDYLDNRNVAALIYQRRKHFINLFVWPADSSTDRSTKSISRQGYQLLHWTDSDFTYWAVSDVNETELETFQQLFARSVASR
jgi:anti-sigma factor RsiW